MGTESALIGNNDIGFVFPSIRLHLPPTSYEALNFVLTVVAALNATTEPESAASFFSKEAVLFATLSGIFNDTNQKILEYFKEFLTIKGLKSGEPIERTVRQLSPNTFGVYLFVPFDFEEKPSITNRMTFIVSYNNMDNKFKIELLHASILPDNDYYNSKKYDYIKEL